MRALAAIVIGVALATLPAACIFVSDFDHLTGGVRDAAPPGADATPDAAADAVPAPVPFTCDGAIFCDMFGSAVTPPWTRAYEMAGGTARIHEDGEARTPPNLLTATTTPAAEYGYLARDIKDPPLPSAISRGTLSFKIRPKVLDPNRRACVAAFVFNDDVDASKTALRLLLGGDGAGATVQEIVQGRAHTIALPRAPQTGGWSTVSLSAEVRGHLTVKLDGETVLDEAADPGWRTTTTLRIVAGINFVEGAAGGQGFDFDFDDLRFDGS